MRYIAHCFAGALALVAAPVLASKPINWADGWLLSTMNDADGSMNHITYSLSGRTGIGAGADWMFADEAVLARVQGHRLLRRWNMPAAQANIYVSAGAGMWFAGQERAAAASLGLMADYETRRLFVLYENDLVAGGKGRDYHWHKARLGWAPYAADYEAVQPWLMIEGTYRSDQPRRWRATPMVRLFTPNWMAEAGISTRGEVMANFMVQW